MLRAEERSLAGEDGGALEDVSELADVARKAALGELGERGRREALARGVFTHTGEEVLGELGDVLLAITKRRDCQWENSQAVEKVETEAAFGCVLFQMLVGGGDDADVDVEDFVVADALELAAIEEAEELGLEREGHFADLVEEQGSAVGGFNTAYPRLDGSSEGSAGVAKQFSFE